MDFGSASGLAEWWIPPPRGFATWVVLLLLMAIYGVRSMIRRSRTPVKDSGASISLRDRRATETSSSTGNNVPIVTESELEALVLILDETKHSGHPAWTPLVNEHTNNLLYSAKMRDPEDGGPTEYLSTTVFLHCTVEILTNFYMDSEYRSKWDKTFESYHRLDVCEHSGVEVGCFIRRFPFMRPREYVIAWKMWKGEDDSVYYFAKQCTHPRAPRSDSFTRIKHYLSGWLISKVPGRDACQIKVWHQEDTNMMAKMAFSCSIWAYIRETEKALKQYKSNHCVRTKDAADFSEQVPADSISSHVSAHNMSLKGQLCDVIKSTKFSVRSSKKMVGNGMLLLAGAVFCAKGSVPLGAKIAAVYAIKKLLKPRWSKKYLTLGSTP